MTCRHTWTETPTGYACTHCDQTSLVCNTCSDPTGNQQLTCDTCLDQTLNLLDSITHALHHYQPTPPSPVKAISYDLEPAKAHHNDTPTRIAISDTHQILATWAEAWADSTQTPVHNTLQYLRAHNKWAAHNPTKSGWFDYRHELRHLRHIARQAAGLLPQHQAAPCAYCGGNVVRDWATPDWDPRPDGLSDHVRCTGCGMTWQDARTWQFIQRQHIRDLPNTHPDAHITLNQARLIWPTIPRTTLTTWARDLTPHDTTPTGTPLYRIADITPLTQRRTTPSRPGRPATPPHTA